MNPRIKIVDQRPRMVNLYNYELRLYKLRGVFAMMLSELDEAIELLEQQKKSDARLIDALVKDDA